MEQELIDMLEVLGTKLDTVIKQTARTSSATSFGKNTDVALVAASDKAVEAAKDAIQAQIDAMMNRYGGTPESFAAAIKKRENPGSMLTGCWADRFEVNEFKKRNPAIVKAYGLIPV